MKPPQLTPNDRSITLSFGIFLFLCLVALVLIRTEALESRPITMSDRVLPLRDGQVLPSTGIPIRIGAYIENMYEFSADHKTFNAVGWIWLSWPDEAEKTFTSNHTSPMHWLDFVNQVDGWDFKVDPVHEQIIRQMDGRHYQNFRFSGQFYVNELDFHRFPFQTVRLPLVFELTEDRAEADKPPLFLVPDEKDSGVGAYIDIMGYQTTAFKVTTAIHEYGSNFGLDSQMAQPRQTRQVAFEVSYKQSVNAALLTLFLPLCVVMALVLFSPMLSASLWDVRLGIPPMALLALIFLQQGYKENLPELPYATYLDLVYNQCYVVNLTLFGLFLWGSNRLHQASEKERPAVISQIDRVDHRFQVGLTLALGLLAAINWLIMVAHH